MKRICLYIIFVIMLNLSASCSKENNAPEPSFLQLTPECTVQTAADAGTKDLSKAVITGTSFVRDSEYAMFVCVASDEASVPFEEYQAGSKNIRCHYYGSSWWYRYDKSSEEFTSLKFLKKLKDNTGLNFYNLDCYAYAPFVSGTTDLHDVRFSIGGVDKDLMDPMYATSSNSKNLTPENHTVSFSFHHTLSLLQIGIRIKYNYSDPRLSAVRIVRKSGALTPLYSSGSMDALDNGRITPGSSCDSVQFVFPNVFESNYNHNVFGYAETDFNCPILPVDYLQDGDYEIHFCVNDRWQDYVYPIKRSDLLHDDGTTYGWKSGMKYHFHFVYDNYMRFENVNVDTHWEDETIRVVF